MWWEVPELPELQQEIFDLKRPLTVMFSSGKNITKQCLQ